jgi:hypothetical protein
MESITLVAFDYTSGRVWRPKTDTDSFLLRHLVGKNHVDHVDRNILLLELAASMHNLEVEYVEAG